MYSEYNKYLEKQRFNMEYNFLSPNCGLKVSAICLGTMTMKKEGKTVSVCVLVTLLSKGGGGGLTQEGGFAHFDLHPIK